MVAKSIAGRSVFLGTFVHSKSLEELEFLHDTAVFVDEKGTIVAIEQLEQGSYPGTEAGFFSKLGWMKDPVTVITAKPGQFFFPGFIGLSFPSIFQALADFH